MSARGERSFPVQHRDHVRHVHLSGDGHVSGEAEGGQLEPAAHAAQPGAGRGSTARNAASATSASGLSPADAEVDQRGEHRAGAPQVLGARAQRPVRPALAGGDDRDRPGVAEVSRQRRSGSQARTDDLDAAAARAAQIDDPFGDGRTSRSTPVTEAMSAGLRLTAVPAESRASSRPTASVASCSAAYAAARSSFHANGSTVMPRSTATVSVVVKDRTSTTTATSAPSAIASAPVGPQSNRTRYAGLPVRRIGRGVTAPGRPTCPG